MRQYMEYNRFYPYDSVILTIAIPSSIIIGIGYFIGLIPTSAVVVYCAGLLLGISAFIAVCKWTEWRYYIQHIEESK